MQVNLGRIFWTYDLISLIKSTYTYYKERKFIKPVFTDSDDFKHVLEKYLKCTLKRDWIDRMYGIVNPNLNENGQFDINSIILEYDTMGVNNNRQVTDYIYKQIMTVRSLFDLYNLFDYINMEIEHVGPVNQDNYLVVFSVVSKNNLIKNLKRFFWHSILYIIVAVLILIFI